MKTSDNAIEHIKEFEGLRLCAYKCAAGVLTIGYGHTKGVKAGQTITKSQADTLLRGDLLPVERYVSGLGLRLTQGQFDALVSFAFNLGTGALGRSTLLQKIRSGSSASVIQAEFRKWVYADGKKLSGLVRRREWESRKWTE